VRVRLQLSVLVLSLSARAWAGDGVRAEPSDELSLFKLEEVVGATVAASTKTEQPVREAPSALSLVRRDQIDSYGWLSLNDVLNRQPGFSPSQDYDRRTVAARGLFESWNNNHLLLLVDGLPHNDSLYGSAYTSELTPLFLVRSVEIIRGPGSALYGTNATNGVLALRTRSADELQAPVEGRVRFGNAGTQTYDLIAGHAWRPVSLVVAFDRYSTDGNNELSYDGSGRIDGAGRLARFPVQDARSNDYVFAKLTVRGGLELQLHHQDWSFGTGHGWLWSVPDQKESMNEQRQIVSLSYRPPPLWHERLQLELVAQYQRHAIDWQMKLYPDGSGVDWPNPDGTVTHVDYPRGVAESLDTQAHQVFLRAQLAWRLWRELSLLVGAEDTVLIYDGDRAHTANADLNQGGTLQPFADGEQHPLGPWLEYVRGKPVDNLGLFVQLATGRIFKRRLSLTAGLRYDLELFDFTDLAQPSRPTLHRNLNQWSPRVGVVLFPWRDLSLKLMVDRAFRAPSAAELFGANTLTLASDPKGLLPEVITTVTIAGDLTLLQHLDVRANWFYEVFENEIAYSIAASNLNHNLYSRTLTGVEAELLFDYNVGAASWLGGFLNYTFAHLLDEQIEDPTIAKSAALTWAPEHTFNAGLNFVGHGFNASIQGHYQGAVARRSSDSLPPFSGDRPPSVAGWFTVDARLSYRFTDWVRLGVQATNLFNSTAYLVKNNNYPFDYRVEGIRVLGTVDVELRSLHL
jgi:iron complex outermembrane receptor protein